LLKLLSISTISTGLLDESGNQLHVHDARVYAANNNDDDRNTTDVVGANAVYDNKHRDITITGHSQHQVRRQHCRLPVRPQA
jgi:hypothetical protein